MIFHHTNESGKEKFKVTDTNFSRISNTTCLDSSEFIDLLRQVIRGKNQKLDNLHFKKVKDVQVSILTTIK